MSQTRWSKTVTLLAYALFISGLAFVLLGSIGEEHKWRQWQTTLCLELGLLLSVIAVGTFIHEYFLREETERRTLERIGQILHPKSLRQVAKNRREFVGYYGWTNRKTRKLVIAGRACLHIMNQRLRGRLVDHIVRRLKKTCDITIMILDPRSRLTGILDITDADESANLRSKLPNFVTAFQLCEKLSQNVLNKDKDLGEGSLSVLVYDHIPYFAYHQEDDRMFVAFYFLQVEGRSPVFEVLSPEVQKLFGDHIEKLRSNPKSTTLLTYNPVLKRRWFNKELFDSIMTYCEKATESAVTR